MADSQHQCSIACFMIFPDLPTALSDSLRTATLCALRGRLRAVEDSLKTKLDKGVCT